MDDEEESNCAETVRGDCNVFEDDEDEGRTDTPAERGCAECLDGGGVGDGCTNVAISSLVY